jgi:hypothetical protein
MSAFPDGHLLHLSVSEMWVVVHHQLPIAAQVDIDLGEIKPMRDGQPNRQQRVFRAMALGPGVACANRH